MPTPADGKLRTGVITGDTERYVATELRRQGLTPVYIGAQAQKSAWSLELLGASIELTHR